MVRMVAQTSVQLAVADDVAPFVSQLGLEAEWAWFLDTISKRFYSALIEVELLSFADDVNAQDRICVSIKSDLDRELFNNLKHAMYVDMRSMAPGLHLVLAIVREF